MGKGLLAFLILCGCGSQKGIDFDDSGVSDASDGAIADAPLFQESGTMKIPVRKIPGLVSITYYETTGVVKPYTFQVNGPEMTTKIANMTATNNDIKGADTEYYDVLRAGRREWNVPDDQGIFDIDGAYLTAGVFLATLPAGGGLNLAEIALNYMGQAPEYGNYVASFLALGDNAIPGDVPKAIDSNLMTCTTMGNTVNDPGKLLRITLGFKSSSGPPK